jgi:hypothetical protein
MLMLVLVFPFLEVLVVSIPLCLIECVSTFFHFPLYIDKLFNKEMQVDTFDYWEEVSFFSH